MSHGLAIQFYCNSRNAKKLEGIAEKFSCREIADSLDEPCQVIITKGASDEDLKRFIYFWGIVKKYKDSAILAGDKLLTSKQAQSVMEWIQCYCNKGYFSNQQEHCRLHPSIEALHGWGCKQLHTVTRHTNYGLYNGVPWYQIGPFDGITQSINKREIKDRLAAEVQIKCLELCPLFSLQRAFDFVAKLPDFINPEIDTEWEYRQSADGTAFIGVKPKQTAISQLIQEL